MPIETKHPEYLAYENDWIDCRVASLGQREVKKKGVRFLPKLSGQTDDMYNAYKQRALFYSITSKTLSALSGMVLDQPPVISHPEAMGRYFEDQSGIQFYEVFTRAVEETLLMGRVGVFIDRPLAGGAPYISVYTTENILNWEEDEDGRLLMVVLREFYTVRDAADRYVQNIRVRYRCLELVDGLLQITVHETQDGKVWELATTSTIQNVGVTMDYIPFFCISPTGLSMSPAKPPMIDIVDINYSHYRTSADLEHGRHFTGLPTPWITGAESQSTMHIGSTKAWVIPEVAAKVGFLEFTGQGLQSLEKALSEKQAQLASLSARLIDNSTRGSEATETVKLRYMSETASLKSVTRAVEALLNKAYSCIMDMESMGGTLNIKLNSAFLDSKLTAAELKAWVEAYLSGGISKEIYIHALKVGKVLPPPGESMGIIPDPPAPEPSPSNTPPNPSSKA